MIAVHPPSAAARAVAPPGARTLAGVLVAVAAVTVLYWGLWFLAPGGRDLLAVLPQDGTYISFENAFPAADGWMALCALVAGVQLLRGRSSAVPWLFMAGGAGMYLGGMDILFDIEHGIYRRLLANPGAVGVEMAINAATVAISMVTMWWAKQHRSWDCAGPSA